ncbi:hypothetical protein EDB81DRAFT_763794 [Dactylonectria macrodidyma]|uniref:Tetratricopeptide repeat protein n=1 Tax=Dactylonectria macrodidyma TaxID=307937 RepID=A0A9P9IU94_9HYPO|nr:hypothetical protein EDB81DRAFT_763794 [Dactylonectria macrodidyma]
MNVEGTPDQPPRLGVRFASAVNREELPDVEDADRFIQFSEDLLAKTTQDSVDQATRLHYLGVAYGERYDRMRTIADLARAIELFEESLGLTPLHHGKRASRLEIWQLLITTDA